MFRAVHRVFARILLLAAAAVLSLVAVGYFVLTESRNNLYEQKKADIRHIVEAAVTIVADFDKRAKSGEMTQEQAQAQVLKALTALRYGNDDYVFIYDLKGNLVLNPLKPEIKGQNRFDVRDPNGVYYVREFIRLAKSGGGHLT
jgi:methyl-accepting chemotaxis protein